MLKDKSLEELQEAVNKSTCLLEVFKYLGLNNPTSNTHYRHWKEIVKTHHLDCSHFKKPASTAKKDKRDIDDYLSNKFTISSSKLRLRLIKEGYLKEECSICKNTEWNNQPIPLQLDHIDGNNSDNSLKNLRLLCPNCHAQTETYCGRNIKKKTKICPTCQQSYTGKTKFCSKLCVRKPDSKHKKSTLSDKEIYDIFVKNNSNYRKASREIGISDNAIRKRIKNYL